MSELLPPMVSVVIPTYNYARFIVEAVESVLAQTYRSVAIIVIDDGSTDDTRQRLQPYHDRIQYVVQNNQGLAASRNNGLALAQGKYVAFLDSDDFWHPQKIELQVAYLEAHADVGTVAARHKSDPKVGWDAIDPSHHAGAIVFSLKQLVMRTRFNPSGALMRRAVLDAVGGFDGTLPGTEDRDMWIRAACHSKVVMLDATLWHYRVHGTNMSNRAALMESSERRTIQKAFRSVRSLRGQRLLCRKAMSYVTLSSSHTYDSASLRGKALLKLLESLWLWPLPLDRADVKASFVRPKRLIVICLRLLGLKSSHREQFGLASPSAAAALAQSEGLT